MSLLSCLSEANVMVQSIDDYIKGVLITENPIRTLLKDRGNVSYLETVFDPIATAIRIFIVEDHMPADQALKVVLVEEFGSQDIVDQRLQNCIARINMIKMIQEESPERELMK